MLHLNSQPSVDALLASAKAAERAGLLAQATRRYRTAFGIIARQGAQYPAETFARLPAMLSDAGLKSEAWYEYCELLVNGCPGRDKSDLAAIWNDRAALFDKMRSFLQHEGEHSDAVVYGALFYIARVIACRYKPDQCHPKAMRSLKTARSLLLPLLRRAGKADALSQLANELHELVGSQRADMVERAATTLLTVLCERGTTRTPNNDRYPMPPLHQLRAELSDDALDDSAHAHS